MDFGYLLLQILGESGCYVFDKINFKRNRISFRHVMFLDFLGMSVFLWLYVVLTHQTLPSFTLISLGLTILIIVTSFAGNFFDYLSLKADDLSLREPLLDFYPILAGLVGYAFFPSERKPVYIWAFIAGTIVIWWGIHRIKMGRLQKKGIGYLILGTVIYAFLPTLYKEALQYLSPAYISALRVSGIFMLSVIFLPLKSMRGITKKRVWYAALASFSACVGTVAGLYAIKSYGVVLTMLFLMLAPALRYLAGHFILRERPKKVEVISSLMLAVIVACTAFVR